MTEKRRYYSISRLSKLLGVTPQTLRNWDKSGKLMPDKRSENGYRYYLKESVRDLIEEMEEQRLMIKIRRENSEDTNNT